MADWPYVGREDEHERIAGLLRQDPPVGAVLAGEAGIGKSRLATEVRDRAAAAGLDVRHAIASPVTTGIPFGALGTHLPVLREIADTPQVAVRAAAQYVLDQAGEDHLLLSVDDAHHLDDATAALLQQVAPSPTVSVLLTIRSRRRDPEPEPMATLRRSGLVERVDLEPLGRAEVEHIVLEALEGPVSPTLVDTLDQLSEGNPLYLRELVTGSLERGTLEVVDGLWQLTAPAPTAQLRDAIEDRLRTIDDDQRRALQLLVVAGSLGYPVLARLAGEVALESLERTGLITVTTDRRRRSVRITHPLHAEILREAMTTRETTQAHRAVADAIEACGARRRDDVLQVAVSRLEAGGEVSAPLIADAARRALAAYDLVLGERLARLALESGGGITAALDRGAALTRLGRQHEADAVFASVDTADASSEDRALFAMEWAECRFWGLHDHEGARRILDDAWGAVDDPGWRDQIVVTGAAYELLTARPAVAIEALAPIMASGSPRGRATCGLTAAASLALVGRGEEALETVDRALDARHALPEELGLVHEGMLWMARTVALTELGRAQEATELGTAGHAAAVEAGVAYAQAWFALTTGRANLLAGRLQEADQWFREGAARYEEIGMTGNRRWCLHGSSWALALGGAHEDASRLAATARSIEPGQVRLMDPEVGRAEAAVLASAGDLAGAADALRAAATLAADAGLATQELGARHDLVRLGDTADVDALLALASGVDGVLAPWAAAHGEAIRDGDGRALGKVAEAFAALGLPLLAAEAAAQAAVVLRTDGERREATRWAREADARARELKARGSPALRRLGATDELTEREREVATLAAAGEPSKEIARRLNVSRRTVDNHLHRAYTKLGVHGREALGDALRRPAAD